MKSDRKKNNGFTPVGDMIAVVAVVALIGAAVLPSHRGATPGSPRLAAKAYLADCGEKMERYHEKNHSYAGASVGTLCPASPTVGSAYTVAFDAAPTPETFSLTATAIDNRAKDPCLNLNIAKTPSGWEAGPDPACEWASGR